MILFVGSDHAGFGMKTQIVDYLKKAGYQVQDMGPDNDQSVDYPDYAEKVAKKVIEAPGEHLGILFCGTGIGISIAANKVRGIRAAHCPDPVSARMAREHNDANIITLGARIIGIEMAKAIVDAWLKAEFSGGRHAQRLEKIKKIENQELY